MTISIRLSEFINWMEINLKSPVTFKTLGKRKDFSAIFDRSNSFLVITTSRGTTHPPLAVKSIEKIFQRYMQAPTDKRDTTSYYEIQKWEDAPDKIRTPYVPAIIRDFMAGTHP